MPTNKEEFLHIPAEDMPSGLFSVDVGEPTFKERMEATKRVPENSNLGYNVPQLMVSMCLKKIAGTKVSFTNKDPIANLRPMSPKDQQFLIAVFTGAFYLDEELVEDVKELAKELREQDAKEFYTIPAERTPEEKLNITFKAPTTGDQIDLDRRFPGNNQQVGYTFEEFFFANMITHINGEEVDKKENPIDRLLSWSNLDAEYCVACFLQMNFIDKEIREKASELGKKYRKRERPTKKVSKSSDTTTATPQ